MDAGDHGDAADGEHHQRDHAEGGAGRGGEGPPHPQGLARPRLLPRRPPRRRRPRRPARLQPMEVEGQGRRDDRRRRRGLHPLRRRAEALPGAGPRQARGLHLPAPSRHQLQVRPTTSTHVCVKCEPKKALCTYQCVLLDVDTLHAAAADAAGGRRRRTPSSTSPRCGSGEGCQSQSRPEREHMLPSARVDRLSSV